MAAEKVAPDTSKTSADYIEGQKLLYDAFKHLTTVSTGSILILATFLEKFLNEPRWRILVVVAFVGFLVSIIASLISMFTFADLILGQVRASNARAKVGAASVVFAFGGFILGIVALITFVLKNFY